MKTKNFAAFILTHGRPEKIITLRALEKCGYTGPVFLLLDDEDETADEYKKLYGEQVIIFSKSRYSGKVDTIDNDPSNRGVVFARNAIFDIAKEMEVEYFIELDDDYTDFRYKFNSAHVYGDWYIRSLDAVLDAVVDYYKKIPALSIAMAQGGDFIGGKLSNACSTIRTKRKVMNTFICSPSRRFSFMGRINEDVNAYVNHGSKGGLFLQLNNLAINQVTTQKSEGGLTELYLDTGTYFKSFLTVIMNPSSVKISVMGSSHMRLHHKVKWDHTVPRILNEKYRK